MLARAVNDAEVAIEVVRTGAEQVRRRFGTTLQRITKGAGDFATDADLQAEQVMLALLGRERPDDAVLAEESGQSGAHGSPRTWLLDPLCGTLNYAAGMQIVAVNAALSTTDGVLAAAVANPFGDDVFWSDGHSAHVRANQRDTPLAPAGDSQLVDLNLDPPFPSAPTLRVADLAGDDMFLASFRPRVVSSSLALTRVATGQRAGYITDGDIRHSVHFSAGLAICAAAGCSITDLHGRAWGSSPQGAIVAADDKTHTALLGLLHRDR